MSDRILRLSTNGDSSALATAVHAFTCRPPAAPVARARGLGDVAQIAVQFAPSLAMVLAVWLKRQSSKSIEIEVSKPGGKKVKIKAAAVDGKSLQDAVEHVRTLLNS